MRRPPWDVLAGGLVLAFSWGYMLLTAATEDLTVIGAAIVMVPPTVIILILSTTRLHYTEDAQDALRIARAAYRHANAADARSAALEAHVAGDEPEPTGRHSR